MRENLTPALKRGEVVSSKLHRKPEDSCFLMGILNITPDSFYSNSRANGVESAIKKALDMIENGATWIDIGGESTRPGASPVSVEEEMKRVIPILKKLREIKPECMISVDTRRVEVAEMAIKHGADMINDISGLRDQKMLNLIVQSGCSICIMHMNGNPGNMQNNPKYDDVVSEVLDYLHNKAKQLIELGHPKNLIVIDPGIGFGKKLEHNLELLKSVEKFKQEGYSLLWGISRKSMIGQITGKEKSEDRFAGTIATSVFANDNGVDILRIHDVDEHKDLFKVMDALRG